METLGRFGEPCGSRHIQTYTNICLKLLPELRYWVTSQSQPLVPGHSYALQYRKGPTILCEFGDIQSNVVIVEIFNRKSFLGCTDMKRYDAWKFHEERNFDFLFFSQE